MGDPAMAAAVAAAVNCCWSWPKICVNVQKVCNMFIFFRNCLKNLQFFKYDFN